jgi:hypothetical protein
MLLQTIDHFHRTNKSSKRCAVFPFDPDEVMIPPMNRRLLLPALCLLAACGTRENPQSASPAANIDPVPAAATSESPSPTPGTRPVPDTSIALINFERRGCGGACPSYSLRINHRGEIQYEGRSNVPTEGTRTATIPPEKAQELVNKFMELKFFDLELDYAPNPASSDDLATLSMIKEDFAKAVTYRRGDPSSPAALAELEKLLHEAINADQWLK